MTYRNTCPQVPTRPSSGARSRQAPRPPTDPSRPPLTGAPALTWGPARTSGRCSPWLEKRQTSVGQAAGQRTPSACPALWTASNTQPALLASRTSVRRWGLFVPGHAEPLASPAPSGRSTQPGGGRVGPSGISGKPLRHSQQQGDGENYG